MRKTIWLVAVVMSMALAAGCGKRETPMDGIGTLKFGKSTLDDWGYPCNPPSNGQTYCQASPLEKAHFVSLGGQNGAAGALFGGTEKTAPLVEIDILVERCNGPELRAWLKSQVGTASEEREGAAFWKQKIVFIAAVVPPGTGECKVNFVETKNTARVDKLRERQ
ncbi:MAG TPA: hypothetical protein VML75_15970 [Kofleriaceae bacterium]|nr:hypothetical protein [Kofleriaceae bacterium]